MFCRVGLRQLDEKVRDLGDDGIDVPLPLFRRRRRGIADARIVGHLSPLARGPGPALAQRGYSEFARRAGTRLRKRRRALGGDVLHHTRLELTRMIAEVETSVMQ